MPQGVCSYIFLSHPNTKDRRQKAVFCVGRSSGDINAGLACMFLLSDSPSRE